LSIIRSTTASAALLAALLIAPLALLLVQAADADPQRRGARRPARDPAEQPAEPPPPEPAPVRAAEPEPPPPSGFYVGPSACGGANCHGAQRAYDVFAVQQNEFGIWLHDDRHSSAYEVLGNERSQAIAANLRLPQPAYESQVCLDCHTLDPPPEQLRGDRFDDTAGVSCESCHGPASGWIEDHHTAESWTREDSLAAGLVDLSDPSRRAALCLGCHAGDGERRVDHRLLAAGHPQLVFELDNFAQAMPSHWPPPRRYGDREAEVAAGRGAAAWAVGQVASFRAGLDLLASQADSGAWPEFTAMRCTDCHHSLAEQRWLGEAGGRQPLGLPRWSPARWAVLRHLVDAFAPGERDALDRRVANLSERVARFAPAAEVAAEARAVSDALEGVAPSVGAVRWDDRRTSAMLLRLAADRGTVSGGDRETAEQLFLALSSLSGELFDRDPRLVTTPVSRTLRTMELMFEEPNAYDRRRFAGELERFETELRAALREGDTRR